MAGIYETFYKLTTDPFRLSPDPRFSFGHPSYKKAKAYMQYALQRGEGFIMVTGSPGTGKTTLINDMLAQIDDARITVVSLLSTRLKPDEMLHMVATSLGVSSDEARKSTLLVKIKEALTERHRAQRRVVLMVDEAQDLSAGVVEELRLLSNMQMGNNLLLQVFLVGQEPLVKLVKKPEMEHLRQRIIAATHLDPLSIEDTAAFIVYRLKRAGWKGDPVITSNALESIYRYSGGVPRRINLVCSRLLFFGAVEKKHTLDRADVDNVIEGMQEEMLFGEKTTPSPADEDNRSRASDRSFAQRVRGASSVAYAVPDNALEEPDPAVPLSKFFDVVSEKPDDFLEVVPADLETEAKAGERIEPLFSEALPADELPSLEALEAELGNNRVEALEAESTVTRPSDVVQPVEPLAASNTKSHSHWAEIDTDERPRPYAARSKKPRGRGWSGIVLTFVLLVAVASVAFVFFRLQQGEDIDIRERVTSWLEERGISLVLPLKDPNEAGTALPRNQAVDENVRLRGEESAPAVTGLIERRSVVPETPAAEAEVERRRQSARAVSDLTGKPVSGEPDVADQVTATLAEDALTAPAEENGTDQQVEGDIAETATLTPAASDPPAQDSAVLSDSISGKPSTEISGPKTPSKVKGVEQEPKVPEQAPQPVAQISRVPEKSIPNKKPVEMASLAAGRHSKMPVGELAVLKTGPKRIPASLPAAFVSNEGRDYSLTEIRSSLKSGRWGSFGKPAALLPSTVNHCKDEGSRVMCRTASRQQAKDENGNNVVYQIESAMDGFSSRGTFQVQYRVMESTMNVPNQRITAGPQPSVKPGWKVSEYETLCRIVHPRLIRCFGGEEGVFSYTLLD